MVRFTRCDDCKKWVKDENIDYFSAGAVEWKVCGECSKIRRSEKYG